MPKLIDQITKVEVSVSSPYADYALSCELGDARYHIWIARGARTYDARGYDIHKNSVIPSGPGYFKHRAISATAKFGKELSEAMLAVALRDKLFEKAEAAQAERERVEQEEYKRAHAEKLKEKAGPELYRVLKAIAEWYEQGTAQGPNGGALLFDDDRILTEHIQAAIKQAKGE